MELKAYLDGYVEVGIDYLFPGKSKVFAQWFTGTARLQVGELLHYEHAGYFSVYEKDIFLSFENGHLVKTSERINEAPTQETGEKDEDLQPVKEQSCISRAMNWLLIYFRPRKWKRPL